MVSCFDVSEAAVNPYPLMLVAYSESGFLFVEVETAGKLSLVTEHMRKYAGRHLCVHVFYT